MATSSWKDLEEYLRDILAESIEQTSSRCSRGEKPRISDESLRSFRHRSTPPQETVNSSPSHLLA